MRHIGVTGASTVAAVTATVGIVTALIGAPPARAGAYDINGTYIATSNGDWAKTNEQYRDEKTVVSTWTIDTECNSPYDCNGTVHSDLGWTAPIYTRNGMWYVVRDLPNWAPCPDGSTGHATQRFMFYAVGPDNQVALESDTFAGYDKTVGDSGACGVNRWQVIEMPFKLTKSG